MKKGVLHSRPMMRLFWKVCAFTLQQKQRDCSSGPLARGYKVNQRVPFNNNLGWCSLILLPCSCKLVKIIWHCYRAGNSIVTVVDELIWKFTKKLQIQRKSNNNAIWCSLILSPCSCELTKFVWQCFHSFLIAFS
jgi:hypothetical protein